MSLRINEISARSGNTVTFKSHLFVDIGDVSFELTPNRIAAINAELFATQAANSAAAAAQSALEAGLSKDAAISAAEASGDVIFYDTFADLTAALPLPEFQVVQVFIDENYEDNRTFYRIESGVPVFKIIAGSGVIDPGAIGFEELNSELNFISPLGNLAFQNDLQEGQINKIFLTRNGSFSTGTKTRNLVNNFNANIIATLPDSPSAGDWVIFQMPGGTNNFTINRNGKKIQNLEENLVVDQYTGSFMLQFRNEDFGWIVLNG